ncbi:MAG: hypothetical protein KJ571_11125 [Bacteroidetes bacterium]|nr:hypothetical protein [Bacteroidota bacterium]
MTVILYAIDIVNSTIIKKIISKTFVVILFAFLLSPSFLKAQLNDSDPVLVKVGNLEISESEFIYRLNFSPKEGIQDKSGSEGIKKELLYTIIAEKLWANEAVEKGFENHASVLTAKKSIEKMFVRDELYRREIKDKVNVNPGLISDGLNKYSKILEVGVFFSETADPVFDVYDKLNKENNLSNITRGIDTSKIIYKSVDIGFGDMPPFLETILYNLETDGYSQPIEIENGWNLYYLKQIKLRNDLQDADDYKEVLKILKKRDENKYYETFYSDFFKDKKIDVDGKLFLQLCNNIKTVFDKKNTDRQKDKLFLDSYDVNEILSLFKNKENESAFIKFEIDPIDLESFIREISFTAFSVSTSDIDTIKIYLNKKTKEYIKYELLSREGYSLGLDKTLDVKKWVDIWYENFLFQYIKNNFDNPNTENPDPGFYSVMSSDSENIKNEKTNPLFKDYINQTIKLADKYKYEINDEIYSQIEQGNINLFVLRHLGFGGTISGVPSSPVFIEWYLELQKRRNENPDNVL